MSCSTRLSPILKHQSVKVFIRRSISGFVFHSGFVFQKLSSSLVLLILLAPMIAEAWVARGTEEFNISLGCKPEVLRESMAYHFKRSSDSNGYQAWSELEKKIQAYFDRCAKELNDGSVAKIVDYAELNYMEYDYWKHPGFRPVAFNLPGEEVVYRGYLGLKPGGVKRPLVIFQCGLGCDNGEAALRQMAIMFYDMGPFHVLLMPSNTGQQFVEENKVFAIGGLQEGRQLVKMSQQIQSGEWKYSKYISEIHLFGTSLGGHSSYYAAAYADHSPKQGEDNPLFATVAVGCPVVDLKSSLEHLTGTAFMAKVVRGTVLGNIVKVLSFVPFFESVIGDQPTTYNPSGEELRRMLVSGTHDYYGKKLSRASWSLPPLEDYRGERSEEVWKNLDSSQSVIPELTRPVFSWAPKDDDIVLYDTNSKVAYKTDVRKKQNRKLFKLETDVGGHCAFPARYGWQASSVVFNSLFESRSPELLSQRRFRLVKIPSNLFSSKARANGRNWRIRSQWIAYPGKDYVELRSFFQQKLCRERGSSIHRCREDVIVRVPLKLLGLSHKAFLKTDVEAQSFTRWLNARITMETSSGIRLGQTNNPSYFKILEYKNN